MLIEEGIEIVAPSRESITIDAGGNSRVIRVASGLFDVRLSGLVITGGSTTGNGGGAEFLSSGTLTVEDSLVTDNSASVNGGGLFSQGDLVARNSTIDDNQASTEGGGIRIETPSRTVTVISSTISNNTAGFGGGISADNIDLSGSTVSTNTATSDGGGLFSFSGTVALTGSTITGNQAAGFGGGLRTSSTVPLVHNTIIAGNTSTSSSSDDVSGTLNSASSFNLIGDGSGMTGVTDGANDNQVGTSATPIDPGLGPLQNNGGPMLTHALLVPSPARNAGDPAVAFDANEFDQRGEPFSRVINDRIDIGALEAIPHYVVSQLTDEFDASDIDPATFDPDDLSLREAIALANSTDDIDMIAFDFASAGPHELNVTSSLPAITSPLVIDGTSQSGYVGSPLVGINGAAAGTNGDGISVQAEDVTIRGLAVYGFDRDGIRIIGGESHLISDNYVGLDSEGNADPNFIGIRIINSADSVIDDNTISGNNRAGVFVSSALTKGNTFINNRIGSDPTGTSAIPNATDGLTLRGGFNQVGLPGQGNLISGNIRSGILTQGVDRGSNKIQGNVIGLNSAGENLPNLIGLHIQNELNEIGGVEDGEENVISGNSAFGVAISTSNARENSVFGNFIGTDATGENPSNASLFGVRLTNAVENTIGGIDDGQANVISGHAGSGVLLAFAGTKDNEIVGNRIGTNLAGDTAVPNGGDGARIVQGASDNEFRENQVSGNQGRGFSTDGANTRGNDFLFNLIGTDESGSNALHNGTGGTLRLLAPESEISGNTISGPDSGILAFRNATDLVIQDNIIGLDNGPQMTNGIRFLAGAERSQITGNTIAHNEKGILVERGTGHRIQGNSIFDNSVIGIDLGTDGGTANDAGDADTGANNLQNTPVLISATLASGTLSLTYNVDSTNGNSAYDLEVEFFLSDGNGQGRTLLGSDQYTSSNIGQNRGVSIHVDDIVAGNMVVATATDADGNTSEFSLQIEIQ